MRKGYVNTGSLSPTKWGRGQVRGLPTHNACLARCQVDQREVIAKIQLMSEYSDSVTRREEIRYPLIGRRAMAFVIDSTIIIVTFILSGLAVSNLNLSTPVRIGMPVGLIFLLDPILVSSMGMTIGHRIMGLRICKQGNLRKLNIFESILRFFIKVLFGWLSLVSVLITRRHQAIHDMSVKSLVILDNPDKFGDHEKLTERLDEEKDGWIYPSKARRVFFILGYLFIANFLIAVPTELLAFLFLEVLRLNSVYSTMIPNIIGGIAFIALAFYLVGRCWRGEMPGCRVLKDEVAEKPKQATAAPKD